MAKKISGLEYRYSTNCFTLHTCRVFMEDGKEFQTGEHAKGFMPDMIAELEMELEGHEHELAFVRAMWPQHVIDAYHEFRANLYKEFN